VDAGEYYYNVVVEELVEVLVVADVGDNLKMNQICFFKFSQSLYKN
jgi:hypothetical protein